MSKSHVSLEKQLCIVTGKEFETNSILLDKRLKPSMDMYTTTGYGISPEVQEKFDEGYMAFIEIDVEKSDVDSKGFVKPEGAFRTGALAYVKRELIERAFNFPEDIIKSNFTFVDQDFIKMLEKMQQNAEE